MHLGKVIVRHIGQVSMTKYKILYVRVVACTSVCRYVHMNVRAYVRTCVRVCPR
jgi:hypothetical protein